MTGPEASVGTASPTDAADPPELREYADQVRASADGRKSFIIQNSEPRHFVIVMRNMFRIARSSIFIYANHLSQSEHDGHQTDGAEPVYADPQVVSAAVGFVTGDMDTAGAPQQREVKIIVREKLDSDPNAAFAGHPLLRKIIEAPNRIARVSIAIARDTEIDAYTLPPLNFSVVDDTAYRYEVEGIRANANFGGLAMALQLRTRFNAMWGRITAYASSAPVNSIAPLVAVFKPGSTNPALPTSVLPPLADNTELWRDYFFRIPPKGQIQRVA